MAARAHREECALHLRNTYAAPRVSATTLAIAAGLAFAVGALWKLGQQRQPQSRLDAWRAQLPELPSRQSLESLLPRREMVWPCPMESGRFRYANCER